MGILTFPCGCCISSSMFGEHETLDVTVCFNHAISNKLIQESLKALAQVVISEIQ